MSQQPSFFVDILQGNLDELSRLCGSTVDDHPSSLEEAYAGVIRSFLRGRVDNLKSIREFAGQKFSLDQELPFFDICCVLRERIRERSFDLHALAQAEGLVQTPTRWQGEIALLIATLLTVYDDYKKAQPRFIEAAFHFERLGAHRKALRARMNVLVCESHLYPNRNLIAPYHDLFRSALKKETGDLIVATTCLLNISRDYQTAGALLMALKEVNRALKLLEFHFGTLNHDLALSHRAHLYLQLGRHIEARIDFEAASISPFPEVKAALAVLSPLLEGQEPVQGEHLLPTWQERVEELQKWGLGDGVKLSPLEEKLILFLSSGPKHRLDILEELYGSDLSHETRANRFKSLLTTFRKRWSYLIICEKGMYRVTEDVPLPKLKAVLK